MQMGSLHHNVELGTKRPAHGFGQGGAFFVGDVTDAKAEREAVRAERVGAVRAIAGAGHDGRDVGVRVAQSRTEEVAGSTAFTRTGTLLMRGLPV